MDCQHSENEINDFITSGYNGLPVLGSGISKTAFELPCKRHVLKVGRHNNYSIAREARLWAEAEDATLRNRLAPIILYGMCGEDAWLVMERCTTFKDAQRDKMRREVNRVQKLFINCGAIMCRRFGMYDLHEYNLGILNNRVVIIDYGED